MLFYGELSFCDSEEANLGSRHFYASSEGTGCRVYVSPWGGSDAEMYIIFIFFLKVLNWKDVVTGMCRWHWISQHFVSTSTLYLLFEQATTTSSILL